MDVFARAPPTLAVASRRTRENLPSNLPSLKTTTNHKTTMKPLNLNQAAKTCKKSKAAILDAIRSGRLSAKQNQLKVWEIDPAELFRVYPFEVEAYQSTSKPTNLQNLDQPSKNQELTSNVFQEIIDKIEKERIREREQMQATIDDLRKRLDEEAQERRNLTKLLTHQTEQAKNEKKENLLFRKIFKNKS